MNLINGDNHNHLVKITILVIKTFEYFSNFYLVVNKLTADTTSDEKKADPVDYHVRMDHYIDNNK